MNTGGRRRRGEAGKAKGKGGGGGGAQGKSEEGEGADGGRPQQWFMHRQAKHETRNAARW